MSVLRVYLPSECDADGVPLDWARCRTCEGCGQLRIDGDGPFACPKCEGHGSLEAVALIASAFPGLQQQVGAPPYRPEDHGISPISVSREALDAMVIRCADCAHPMSEGEWQGRKWTPEFYLTPSGEFSLRRRGPGVHYSSCDDRCLHEVEQIGDGGCWAPPPRGVVGETVTPSHWLWRGDKARASWRHVEVRFLEGRDDLRREYMVVLCLRCWAARTATS